MDLGSTTETIVVHTTNIAMKGSILGLDVKSLVLGAIASAMMIGTGRVRSPMQGLSTCAISSLTAGAVTPLLTQIIVINIVLKYPMLNVRDTHIMVSTAISVLIGGFFQLISPVLIEMAKRYIEKKTRRFK